MARDDLNALLAFRAVLLRQDGGGRYAPLSRGVFIVTEHTNGAMLVNGIELRPREGSRSLMAGIYYGRQRLVADADAEGQSLPPALPGDLIGMTMGAALVPAYGVLLAGPGLDPNAPGTLSPDGLVCELRRDIGSLHRLVADLDEPVTTSFH